MGRDLQGGVRGGGHEINWKVSKEVFIGRPQVPVLPHGLEATWSTLSQRTASA